MKIVATLALSSLALIATPAAAQTVSTNSYRNTLEYAACVVGANGAGARALLATVPASPEEASATTAVNATAGCRTNGVNAQALRGAIAEKVYLADYPAAPAVPEGTPAPFQGSGNAALALWDVTRCTAMRDPVGVDMLIRSELGSSAQRDAFRRLGPVIGSCVPAGIALNFDREQLRGLLAEGLITARSGGGN